MALWELLQAVRRHLVILAVGTLLTVGALFGIHQHAGLYQEQVGVVLVPPQDYYVKNPFWGRDYNLIAVGGVVMDMSNRGAHVAPTASAAVTLAGRGEKNGYIVNLPNVGGQWVADYDRPILDVQAVGRNEAEVRANMAKALGAIKTSLVNIQADAGVAPDRRITSQLSPSQPTLTYSVGRPSRSLALAFMLGVGLTLATIFIYDERVLSGTRRQRRWMPLTRPDRSGAPSLQALGQG